jgi:hypothetical protein
MKYTFTINQYAVVTNKFNLDVVDCCLLNFMQDFINSEGMEFKIEEGKQYYYFSHKYFIEEVPMLKIKTKAGLRKRLNILEKKGFLDRHPNNQTDGKAYYSMNKKYLSLLFKPKVNESLLLVTSVTTPSQHRLLPPSNESYDNHSISNYSINNKKLKEGKKILFSPSSVSVTSLEVFNSIIKLGCFDSDNTRAYNYIGVCVVQWEKDLLIKKRLEQVKYYKEFLRLTEQGVSTKHDKLVEVIISTDWKKKVEAFNKDVEVFDLEEKRTYATKEEEAYWEMIRKGKEEKANKK